MSRPVNLSLIHALNNHHLVKVPISSDAKHDATVRDATEYWLRVKRGLGFVIVVIEVTGIVSVLYEVSVGKVARKEVGMLWSCADFANEARACDHCLVLLTTDPLSTDDTRNKAAWMAGGAQSKLLMLDMSLTDTQVKSGDQESIARDILADTGEDGRYLMGGNRSYWEKPK